MLRIDGDRGEADLEHPPGVLVDDEVDVALAVPGVDVAQAVPLVGERPQRLGEQHEAVDLHRQLALAGGHHRALDADPVAEIEPVELVVRGFAELRVRHEQLHAARLVAHGGEGQLALAADEQDAPRDRDRGVGLDAGLEAPELVPELGEGAVTRRRLTGYGSTPRSRSASRSARRRARSAGASIAASTGAFGSSAAASSGTRAA